MNRLTKILWRKPSLMGLLTFLLLLPLHVYSQNQWRVFTTQNSVLPTNIIGSIIVDRNNVKWIGTPDGMVRIEGNNWQLFDTTNTPVRTNGIYPSALDSLNNIWCILHEKGAAKFDGTKWTIFDTNNSGLLSNNLIYISIDKNNVKWMGPPGLAKFNDTNWTIYMTTNSGLPHNLVTTVTFEDHIKWIGTFAFSGGMVKYNDTNWIVYNTSNSGLSSNIINYISLDNYNNKWICTYFGGLVKFNSGLNQWTIFNTENSPIPSNFIMTIKISKNNIKFIAPEGEGLTIFDDTTWQTFNINNSPLPDNTITRMDFDRFGNLWIGTHGGIAIYNQNEIIGINKKNIGIPQDFVLYQNFPNPFNSITTIEYELKFNSNVKLSLYDITGKLYKVLVERFSNAGSFKYILNSDNLTSGVYFYQLATDYGIITRKLIIIK